MRCRLCGDAAGWWKRRCADCGSLWDAWQGHRHDGMRRLLQALAQTGVEAEKIQRFLNAEPAVGGGTVRDLIAADMTNQLLDALGQPPSQEGAAVQRLRQRGDWRRLDRPPSE